VPRPRVGPNNEGVARLLLLRWEELRGEVEQEREQRNFKKQVEGDWWWLSARALWRDRYKREVDRREGFGKAKPLSYCWRYLERTKAVEAGKSQVRAVG